MRLNTYTQNDYSGGLNDTTDDKQTKRNEASLLRNWDITYQGQLKKRPGITLVGNLTLITSPSDNVTVSEDISVSEA
jgi:hypothetical protein